MTWIFHADMDAFYASVEQLDDRRLAGLPVIVGGLGRRGVVAAASYEARRFGVRSAMPMATARRLCPDGAYRPPRMRRYAELSATIREVFYSFTPMVEPLSLDEAYLDVSGSLRLFGSAEAIADGLREQVRERTGLAVSVGGGPGKLVAKIASRKAKPDGVLLVPEEAMAAFLEPLAVGEIWGVGPSTEKRLHDLGIAQIGQLARADPSKIEAALGQWGPLLVGLARGEDLRTVECDRARKSYGEENTFAEDVVDGELIEATLFAHAETVARRLRRDEVRGQTVTLKYRPSGPGERFRLVTRAQTLEQATDHGPALAEAAQALWRRERRRGPVRLIGVQVSGLDRDRPTQLGLFRQPTDDRKRALDAALDDITERFGAAALRRGRSRS